jgi:MFS family permease
MIKKDIIKFYCYQFFSNLDFARGIFVIYLTSKGLTGSQIGIVQTILFISSMIFEVPSGMLADRFTKKFAIIFGLLICAIVPILILNSNGATNFYYIFFLLGLGYSLERGADMALLYEKLNSAEMFWSLKYKEILGRARALRYTALALAISVGGVIQNFSWKLVFYSVSACMLLGAISILFFAEAQNHSKVKLQISLKSTLFLMTQSLSTFFRSKKGVGLLILTLVSCFIQAATTPLFIYSQLLFKEYGFNNQHIGFIIAFGLLATSLSSMFAYKIKVKNEVLLCSALCIVLLITLSCFFFRPHYLVAIGLFILSQGLPSVILIHLLEIFNSEFPVDIRTSCLSSQNLISALVLSLTNLIFGKMIDVSSIFIALGSFMFLPAISLILLAVYRYKTNDLN